MTHAITVLTDLKSGLHKTMDRYQADLKDKQSYVDGLKNSIREIRAKLDDIDAALTLLNATQFIVDETKGSCK